MSNDKKPEDQITEAGAVELEKSQLDEASGGADLIASPEPDAQRLLGRAKFTNIVLK